MRKQGFTMIELLLYMVLFSSFLFVLTEIFASSLSIGEESEGAAAIARDGQYILSRLTYDAGISSDIIQPSVLGQQGDSVTFLESGVPVTYSFSGGILTITTTSGTYQLQSYASVVSDFTVRRVGTSSGKPQIQITFTLTSITQSATGPETETFETTVGVR